MKRTSLRYIRSYRVLAAALLYLGTAVVFTLPLVFRMTNEIPEGGGDVYQVVSSIDAGISQVSGTGPVQAVSYLIRNLNTFTPYVLLGLVVGKVPAYDLLFILSYTLSGFGMFLLARQYVKNDMAAFAAGIVFAFAPFHYYQSVAVHLGTMHQEWLPFLVMYLARFFEKFRLRHFLAAGIFAFLTAMSEHQLLAFSLVFVALYSSYRIAIDRSILRNRTFWAYVAGAAALLTVVVFGMFGSLLRVAVSGNNFLSAGINASNKYSIKVLDPLMPPVFHPVWGALSGTIQVVALGGANRGSYFIGFSVLALLVWFAYFVWKRRVAELSNAAYRNDLAFWAVSAVLFYVFSLGASFTVGSNTVYLPYYLLYRFVPFFENIRTTGRIFVLAMLSVSMLSAYALAFFLDRYPARKHALSSGFCALVLLEFWVAPIKTMPIAYSSFYDRIGNDHGNYSLIEIPGSTSYEFASYDMYLNTIAHKTVLNGMPLARKISGQFDMQQGTPVIKQLLYTIPKGNDPDSRDASDVVQSFDYALSNEVLSYHDVRYITISKKYASPEVVRLAEKFIEAHIGTVSRFEDEYLVAYEVRQVQPDGFFLDFNESGQFSRSFTAEDGLTERVMGDRADLRIENLSSADKKVRITVQAKDSGPELRLSARSDRDSGPQMTLGASMKTYSFETVIVPGRNVVTFSVTTPDGRPVPMSKTKTAMEGALVSSIRVETE